MAASADGNIEMDRGARSHGFPEGYFFCIEGHGAPHGAQAPAKSSGETARALDGLVRWSAITAPSPAISTNA
jgi:hypothetical protein